MVDVTHFEQILRSHRKELGQRLDSIEDELEKPGDTDAGERAIEREGDEVLEGVGQVSLNEITAIDSALQRIEAGTFGVCVSCGEDISTERLKAVPYAANCRNCAG